MKNTEIRRIIRLLFITGMSMFFSGCDLQNSFLYYPDTTSPSVSSLEMSGYSPWPEALQNYQALLFERKNIEIKGTVLVFHGNAGNASDRFFYGPVLNTLGYRTLLVEYPGYGGRKGELG